MYTSKYSPQHILHKHPHSMLFTLDDKPSPTHAKHNGYLYNLYISLSIRHIYVTYFDMLNRKHEQRLTIIACSHPAKS